jgi:hypothetical protein
MRSLYYNIQLISSFLLNKIKILYFSIAIILYGINFFPIILCDEEIISSANETDNQKNEKQKFWISLGILIIVSAICLYFLTKGIPSC